MFVFVCFQLFEEIPLQSGVQQNEDIATWFLLEVFKDNLCDTANDQVLTEFIPFSEPFVGVKSVTDKT